MQKESLLAKINKCCDVIHPQFYPKLWQIDPFDLFSWGNRIVTHPSIATSAIADNNMQKIPNMKNIVTLLS